MGKYLVLWEADQTRIPISPQDRGIAWGAMMEVVKEEIEKGTIKDWGLFVGENRGYFVAEGTELEIANSIQHYVPWVIVKVHPVMSVEQTIEIMKTLTEFT